MNCPNCKTDSFITTNYQNISIDECVSCHGVWLDEGKIEKIVSNRITEFSSKETKLTLTMTFSGIPKMLKDKEDSVKSKESIS